MSTLILRESPVDLRFSARQDRDEDIHILRLAGLLPGLRWQGEAAVITMTLEDAATYRDILFDEIDAIAQSRSSAESLRLDARFTTQLLVLLDGIHDPGQVFVIGTTNRLDLLDPALLRPGRFERIIAVPRPDRAAKLAILNIHVRKLPLGPDVELAEIAGGLGEATGADIAFLVREAAHHCLRRTLGNTLLARREALSDTELAELTVCSDDFDVALRVLKKRHESLTESGVALSGE